MALISISLPDFELPRLSNQVLLELSVTLFLVFALAEVIGAVMSGSLSLLGDAVSMCVDVVSYICGVYVEWYKNNHGRFTKWSRLTIEIIIPLVSLLSLIGITIYITSDAVMVLIKPPKVDDVDVVYLYTYSAANLLIDLVVSGLFYFRGTEVFQEPVSVPVLSLDTAINFEDPDDEFGHLDDILEFPKRPELPAEGHDSKSLAVLGKLFFNSNHNPAPANSSNKANLNMISAFTHILGDTLRTISMFVAALVSTLSGIDGDICDAAAAIVVAVSILAICGPIIIDIKNAAVDVWNDDTETSYNVREIGLNRTRTGQQGQYTRVADDDVII
jgi:cation diffusion facilitator family transporter